MLHLALEYVKDYTILFIALSCLGGQIWVQEFTKFDSKYAKPLVKSNLSDLPVKNVLRVSLFMFRVLQL